MKKEKNVFFYLMFFILLLAVILLGINQYQTISSKKSDYRIKTGRLLKIEEKNAELGRGLIRLEKKIKKQFSVKVFSEKDTTEQKIVEVKTELAQIKEQVGNLYSCITAEINDIKRLLDNQDTLKTEIGNNSEEIVSVKKQVKAFESELEKKWKKTIGLIYKHVSQKSLFGIHDKELKEEIEQIRKQ